MPHKIPLLLLFALLVGCLVKAMAGGDAGAVHEWGTFTSVAAGDGSSMIWRPLSGSSDLPCFVHHLDQRNLKAADWGTVRMETPVLYFYPLKSTSFSVHVDFPNGRVTEWYPGASAVQPSTSKSGWIEWKDVRVNEAAGDLPKFGEASHYFAARATDAWNLKSEGEDEKLLFYRGLGSFGVDLQPVVNSNGVSLRNSGVETIPEAILFESDAGRTSYHITRRLRSPVDVSFSELGGGMKNLRQDFEDELMEMGLYRKEAHAMVATWGDSWFEEGLRVFYILPRTKIDALLPISISPAPSQLARVFVGRVELLSPWMRQEIGSALVSGDVTVLKKYGRFLNAFLDEMRSGRNGPPMCEKAKNFLQTAEAQVVTNSWAVPCTK